MLHIPQDVGPNVIWALEAGSGSRRQEGDTGTPVAVNKKKEKNMCLPSLDFIPLLQCQIVDPIFPLRPSENFPHIPPLNSGLPNMLSAKQHLLNNRIHCIFLIIKTYVIFLLSRIKWTEIPHYTDIKKNGYIFFKNQKASDFSWKWHRLLHVVVSFPLDFSKLFKLFIVPPQHCFYGPQVQTHSNEKILNILYSNYLNSK